jgi:hypothetical protein
VLPPALFSGPLAAGGMPESTQQHPGGSQEAGLLQGLPQPTSLQERKSPLISTLTLQVAGFFSSVKNSKHHNMEYRYTFIFVRIADPGCLSQIQIFPSRIQG